MLVLSRKKNEDIVIGGVKPITLTEPIVVRLVEIRSDKVRLGIVAPLNIPVHRREVFAQVWPDAELALPEFSYDGGPV